jgi:hypothetical protein
LRAILQVSTFGCPQAAPWSRISAHFQRIGLPVSGVAGITPAPALTDGDSHPSPTTLPSPRRPRSPSDAEAPPSPISRAWISRGRISAPPATSILAVSAHHLRRQPGLRQLAAYSHRRLLMAGVESDLLIYDGLGHGFMTNAALPETREAQQIAVTF